MDDINGCDSIEISEPDSSETLDDRGFEIKENIEKDVDDSYEAPEKLEMMSDVSEVSDTVLETAQKADLLGDSAEVQLMQSIENMSLEDLRAERDYLIEQKTLDDTLEPMQELVSEMDNNALNELTDGWNRDELQQLRDSLASGDPDVLDAMGFHEPGEGDSDEGHQFVLKR